MSRLTKNISDKQTYCGYEVKDCKYQQIYGFKKYRELEDYVDCDLTLAIDKLGKLEDLEEQLGCPLEVYVKATRKGIWYSIAGIMKHCYIDVIDANEIIFAMKGTNIWFELKKYKKTWFLRKDKSE